MVLYGFGILMANTFVRTEQWKGLRYAAWKVRRLGFLNHRMYGYMFALLLKYREEDEQPWQKYFCTDVDNFYRQASKFLDEQMEEGHYPIRSGVTIKDEEVFFEKYFYEGGGLQLIAHVIDKKYEGLATFYHQNGLLWSERIYKNGIPFTVLSNYNPFDEAVEKGTLFEGNGTLYIYKADGNLDVVETYKDGVKIKVEKAQ
jgi:outer membrane protein assembly factor BamB